MDIRDKGEYREKKRRDGRVYETKDGNMGYGPFTWEARKLILKKLIETQKVINYPLITIEELKAIDEIWDKELDLSRRVLVDLYYEMVGKRLPWDDYKEPLIDENTVQMLDELCMQYNVPLELIRNMLLSVHQNKNYSNSRIMRKNLDQLLNQQWLHYDVLREIEDANNKVDS
jgi:DNA sulfur modification protein DndC